MKEIKIVEYRPELAAAVADMWNKSSEGWGGGSAIVTPEYVAQQEANSDNINLYLAMEDDMVVGYCGLSEYKEDEGSLYIPLLNVRTDYHGKKIGKLLLLKALEQCLRLGWPRLDLYTWPGNTKAVPLYKKCGFFWEERDETTHLMNFIPSVLNNDVVKDFFKELDWYMDSKRIIEVKPDGIKENGFDYYEYLWERDSSRLRMEFERRGRGLRLIETDDYLISATVEESQLVFGREYRVFYDVANKTGKPLEIQLRGRKDKNIEFTFEETILLNHISEKRIEGRFKVGEIQEEQSIWRTHPSVLTKVLINGKETELKVGIRPKFPAKIIARVPHSIAVGETGYFYLDIENNFKEETKFNLIFPKVDFIEMQQSLPILLEGKEKKSIAIPYRLKEYGFYNGLVEIEARLENGEEIFFKKKMGVAFKGFGGKFGGEGEHYWYLCNGVYQLGLGKLNNGVFFGRDQLEAEPTRIMVPKIGKPFASEFNRKPPDSVEIYEEKGAMVLRAAYSSQNFKHLQMIIYTKLFAEGLIEQSIEVKNIADVETSHEVWVNHPFYQKLNRAVLPYDDGIIELEDSIGSVLSDWESSRVSENWIFANDPKNPRGICWSPQYKLNFSNWFMFLEYSLGKIPAGESVITEPLIISLGAFNDWEDFRTFALRRPNAEKKRIKSHLEFTLNGYNPIIKGECTATLRSNRSEYFNGDLEVNLLKDPIEKSLLSKSFKIGEEIREVHLDIKVNENRRIDVVNLQGNIFTQEKNLQALLLHQGDGEVSCEITKEAGLDIYSVDNGVIQIKSAPEFFPSIYSMNYHKEEWLHHSFPTPIAKSWWNPWGGGINHYMEGVSYNSLKKEGTKAEFVTLMDQHQNEWRGIKLHTRLEEHENYKGLEWSQYFVMLPGVPVVATVVEILQKTGKYLPLSEWINGGYLNLINAEKVGWIKPIDNHNSTTYVTGKGAVEIMAESSLICGLEDRADLLQIVADLKATNLSFYINKEVFQVETQCKFNLEDGKRLFTTPVFYLFTEEAIKEEALNDLKNIRFK